MHRRISDYEILNNLFVNEILADSNGFDARTLRELRDAIIANNELIERTWNDHFA